MRLLLKLGLLLGLVCMMGFSANAQSPVTLYFTNDALGTNIWTLSQSSPAGPSVSTTTASNAASTTGWYHLDPGLSDSTNEASEPSNTAPGWNTIWVSADTFNGSFAAGNWVLTVRKTDNRSARVGVFHADIYAVTSQTNQASGSTLIAHCSSVGDSWTGAAATITATCTTAGVTTVASKYLAIRTLAQVTTGSTSSGAYTVIIEDTTNGLTKMVTPNYTATSVPYTKDGAAAFGLACTADTCVESTTNFTQPTISFATTVSAAPGFARSATASFDLASVASGEKPTGGQSGIGNAGLTFTCLTCIELAKDFPQPTLHLVPSVAAKTSLSRTPSGSLNFATTASADSSGLHNFTRSVSATLGFATQSCIELSRSLTGVGVGLTTRATYCLERSFPNTSLAFTTSAVASSVPGIHAQAGNAASSINLATTANARRALKRVGAASVDFATLNTRLRTLNRPDTASVGFSASAAIQRSLFRPAAAAPAFATTVAVKRGLHANANTTFNLATLTGAVSAQNSSSGNASFAFATSASIRRAMHGNEAVALNIAPLVAVQSNMHKTATGTFAMTTSATAVKGSASTRRVLILGAS